MKKHYPWLWFDADGTLFDYDRAEATALANAFKSLNMRYEDGYLDIYRRINQGLWQALARREITPAVLRVNRFEVLLEAIDISGSPEQLSTAYVEQLATYSDLISGAYEVLHALQGTCRFAILTNGSQAVQRSRLAHSSIQEFISDLIISEEIGADKPQSSFLSTAFARLGNPAKSDVLLIGDSLTSDIQGGVDYGLDTCWYNPTGEPLPDDLQVTYEIGHLHELLEILE